jgi:hypothetical protein
MRTHCPRSTFFNQEPALDAEVRDRLLASKPTVFHRCTHCGIAISTARNSLLIGGVTPALGQAPSAESVEQGVTPMDKIDMGIPYPG